MGLAEIFVATLTLLVSRAAIGDTALLNIIETVGYSGQLQCSVGDGTCDNILWSRISRSLSLDTIYVSGRVLPPFADKYNVNVSASRQCTLWIHRLSLSDAGVFTCTDLMSSSENKNSAVVTVVESLPKLTTNVTSSGDVVDGEVVMISCHVKYSSSTTMNIHLTITDDRGQSLSSSDERGDSSEISTSAIVPVTYSHDAAQPQFGPFHCQVTATQTSSEREFAHNDVSMRSQATPAQDILCPVKNVRPGPDKTMFAAGETVTCEADGYPEPQFYWQRVSDGGKNVSYTAELTESLTNHTYQCRVTNVVRGQMHVAVSAVISFNGTEPSPFGLGQGGLTVFGIVVGCVIVIIVIIVVVVIIRMIKRQKSRGGESTGMMEK